MVVQFSISLCLFISLFFSLSGSMAYFGCNFTNNTRCRFYLMPNSTALLYSPVDHQNSWSQVPQKNYPVIYTFQHRDIFIKNNKRAKTCFLFISRRFGAGNRPDPRDIQKSMATFPWYTVIMSDCLRNLTGRGYILRRNIICPLIGARNFLSTSIYAEWHFILGFFSCLPLIVKYRTQQHHANTSDRMCIQYYNPENYTLNICGICCLKVECLMKKKAAR